jgi:predicted nucleic acid-binding protein
MKYCLDTNIISNLFKDDSKYDELRDRYKEVENNKRNEIVTSIIVLGEIKQGLKFYEIEFEKFEKDITLRKSKIDEKYDSDKFTNDEFIKLSNDEKMKIDGESLSEKNNHLCNLDLIKRTNTFFQEINVFEINSHVVSKYVDIYYLQIDRREDLKKLNKEKLKDKIQKSYHDLWIAATCLANNFTLITNNTKDFDFIPTLHIEDWT